MSKSYARVTQLQNDNFRPVANHFIIESEDGTRFQSYESTVLFVPAYDGTDKKWVFGKDWDYSKTTWKWLRYFIMNYAITGFMMEVFGTNDVRMEDVRKAIKNGTVLYDENL